jgi:DNA-binding GntR family transcriptional regulator
LSTPHYLSVRDEIARGIAALGVGAKLASERELQAILGAARGTVREALFQLEAEGLIYRRDRSGWYVCPAPIVYDPTQWAGFMAYVSEQGRTPSTETLSAELAPASPAVAQALGFEPQSRPVYALRRRRAVDGRAVLVEDIHVDPQIAPDLLKFSLNNSLTRILREAYGVSIVRTRLDMRPCALARAEAAALAAKPGAPGLLILRTSFDASGRAVEYDREVWRHDAVRLHIDISQPLTAAAFEAGVLPRGARLLEASGSTHLTAAADRYGETDPG